MVGSDAKKSNWNRIFSSFYGTFVRLPERLTFWPWNLWPSGWLSGAQVGERFHDGSSMTGSVGHSPVGEVWKCFHMILAVTVLIGVYRICFSEIMCFFKWMSMTFLLISSKNPWGFEVLPRPETNIISLKRCHPQRAVVFHPLNFHVRTVNSQGV